MRREPVIANPKVAIVGMILESNAFAPAVSGDSFREFLFLENSSILNQARAEPSSLPREIAAFVRMMDATGDWQPLPILVTANPPGGPVEHAFFESVVNSMTQSLRASEGIDVVYVANHGAMTTTETEDADGELLARIRQAVGDDALIVMTLDLHANISGRMVDNTDCTIAYQTNPHVDQIERGEEAAVTVRQFCAALAAPRQAWVRLPLTPPSVTLLTAEGPYADAIRFGQARKRELRGEILNVSILGGFVFSDTAKNGICTIVTARSDPAIAEQLANEIAARIWSQRSQYSRTLTSVDAAIAMVERVTTDDKAAAVLYSDAGDNPGGGGSGTTVELLKALIDADCRGIIYGCFHEPQLAALAHDKGVGATFDATFNAAAPPGCGDALVTPVTVAALGDGDIVGRRGIYESRRLTVGRHTALTVGASRGVTVVVLSQRYQAADPVFFECLDIDIGQARVVVVKSRGHFRAGFDLWFSPSNIYEIDTLGLTSPVLSRFQWRRLPRPVYPLDPDTVWPGR